MAALIVGTKAPEFELKTLDGEDFMLAEGLARGPVLLVFFKVSCPTCQYALPFWERIYKAYGSDSEKSAVTIVGISQNNAKDTAAFAKEFAITFPLLLDDASSYPVSNAYGLTNVPTVFWIAQDGEIEVSSVSWLKADFEAVNRKIADLGKIPAAPIFKPNEQVRDFRAG